MTAAAENILDGLGQHLTASAVTVTVGWPPPSPTFASPEAAAAELPLPWWLTSVAATPEMCQTTCRLLAGVGFAAVGGRR